MGKWPLVSYLGAAAAGVLIFLRIVTNGITDVERQADALRERQAAAKSQPQGKKVVLVF